MILAGLLMLLPLESPEALRQRKARRLEKKQVKRERKEQKAAHRR